MGQLEGQRKLPLYSRRSFLVAGGIGMLSTTLLYRRGLELWRQAPEIFISARTDSAGKHFVNGFDISGKEQFSFEVDLRCHGVAMNPARRFRAVIFARRPGDLAYEVDFGEGEVRRKITSPSGRHFYGHGAYSDDGRYLFCSENEIETGRGLIAIYDGDNLKRLGEFESHGIGPHEVRMLRDEKTLVVANGGILTHPDKGREKLNLDTMKPSLAYIDISSGKVKGQYFLDQHQLSIRHISVGADDKVAIAMQFEGDKRENPPLIAFHRGEDRIRQAKVPEFLGKQMKNYTASICVDPRSGVACVSSPRGNLVSFWNSKDGSFLDSLSIRDAGGVSLDEARRKFVVTTGAGRIYTIPVSTHRPDNVIRTTNTKWDNHISLSI